MIPFGVDGLFIVTNIVGDLFLVVREVLLLFGVTIEFFVCDEVLCNSIPIKYFNIFVLPRSFLDIVYINRSVIYLL